MDYKDFFEFSGVINSDKYFAYVDSNATTASIEKRLLVGDYSGFVFPIVFRQKEHKPLDIIVTGATSLYLISEKFKRILIEYQLTGWDVFPVKLIDKNCAEIVGYHGLSIYGRCGPIDYKKCKVFEKRYVENGPLVKDYIGLPVGLDTWDGSDLFLPKGNLGIIISPKAGSAFKKSMITNLILTPLSDIIIPEEMLKIRNLI